MSTKFGSKIITEGLVLHLDAKNIKSYIGSGTDWFDLSGNENNATMYNLTYDDGSIIYNAANDRAVISNYFITGATSLSMSAWFMMTGGAGTYRCIVHKGTDTSVGNSEYWTGFSGANTIVSTIGAGSGVGWAAGNTGISGILDTWYNTCSVWNGSNVRVFVNGDYKMNYNLLSLTQNNLYTRIGASSDTGAYQVIGKISIVNIYKNVALTDSQVKSNFNALRGRFGI